MESRGLWQPVAAVVVVLALFFVLVNVLEPEPQQAPPPGTTASAKGSAGDAPKADRPWVVFGDSFAEGTGADTPGETGFPQLLGECVSELVLTDAQGGTGYLEPGPRNAPTPRSIIGQRVETTMRELAPPKVTLFAAGLNDRDRVGVAQTSSPEQATAAATAAWEKAKAEAPRTRMVILGPFWTDEEPDEAIFAVRDVLRDAAEDAGYLFIDPVEWLVGRAKMVGSDGTHPTQVGHEYIAKRLAAELTSAGVVKRSGC